MTLSLVLPCFNEEEVIEHTVREVFAWLGHEHIHGEVIVVNDGSLDATQVILEHLATVYPNLVIVRHASNKGYGAAIRSGCDIAKMENVAFMDSDGQFRVRDISMLLSHLQEVEFVAGIRTERADNLVRVFNAFLYNLFIRWILNVNVFDIDCGMKVFRRHLWPQIRPIFATGGLFSAEMLFNVQRKGIVLHQVPVAHYPRLHGNATGAKLHVITRMFKELWQLLRASRRQVAFS